MMENKLWVALCALLLTNMGHAEKGALASDSSLDPLSHPATAPNALAASSSSTSNLSSSTTAVEATTSPTTELKNKNDTNMSPSLAQNQSNNSTSQPPVLPFGNITTTSHIPHTAIPTNPPPTAKTASVDAIKTTILNQSVHPETHSSTFASAPEPTKPANTTTATNSSQSSSPSSTDSSQKPPNIEPQTHRDLSTTPLDRPKSQTQPTTSPSAHAKAHVDTQTQLNVGGDTTIVHETPPLDPLLAGLVSAFIITAVIITLFLFLKLRRRNSRPEFHRLQDLPMDDMMEDTPLSMYTY